MEIKLVGDGVGFLKGKKESLLVDPSREVLAGGKYPARIILMTSKRGILGGKTEGVVIQGPGEYEIGGVEIVGYRAGEDSTIYVVEMDGLTVGVLGSLKEELNEKRVEKIEGMDVLLAPVMIKDQVSAGVVLEWAKKWGVNYLIPVGWEEDELSLNKFLDMADEEGAEKFDSLKIEKDNLPDGLEIKVLKKV